MRFARALLQLTLIGNELLDLLLGIIDEDEEGLTSIAELLFDNKLFRLVVDLCGFVLLFLFDDAADVDKVVISNIDDNANVICSFKNKIPFFSTSSSKRLNKAIERVISMSIYLPFLSN